MHGRAAGEYPRVVREQKLFMVGDSSLNFDSGEGNAFAEERDAGSDGQSHGCDVVETNDLSDLAFSLYGRIDIKQILYQRKLGDWALWRGTTLAHPSLPSFDMAFTTDVNVQVCLMLPSPRLVVLGCVPGQVIAAKVVYFVSVFVDTYERRCEHADRLQMWIAVLPPSQLEIHTPRLMYGVA